MKTELVLFGTRIHLASQSRRRWLVILVYAGLAALTLAWTGYFNESFNVVLFLVLPLSVAWRIFGGRNGEARGLLPPFDRGDERERNRRDHAHYLAYSYLDLVFVPAIFAAGLKVHPLIPAGDPALREFLGHLPYGLLSAAVVLYYTLPQAILLWTEPDMEQEPE